MNISINNVSHIYPQGKNSLVALQNINTSINDGEFVALIGPSGCGKSTLMRIIAGLLNPSCGDVQIGGKTPTQIREEKQIGWLSQNPALLPWLTVEENILLALKINSRKKINRNLPNNILRVVGLSEFSNAYPYTLSGGMQQRVALARTLILGAKIWLMDEPFAALDEFTREAMVQELMRILSEIRPTVIWVTHNISEAIHMADRIILMSSRPGQILEDVYVDLPFPRDETSAEFISILKNLRDHIGSANIEDRKIILSV